MAGIVSFDGTRLDPAETLTDWSGWGATPTIEVDYKYQGLFCISAQVKKADVGFYYTSPTTDDFATNDYVFIAKLIQTNKDDIDEEGLRLFIGNDETNYYQFDIYPLPTDYPISGGFQIVPINPNIAIYQDVTVGTPDLTTVDLYGIRSNATQQSKSPNLGLDAIDILSSGQGLTITGTGATFTDFINYDEGDVNNRYGIVSTRDGILYVTGVLSLGTTATSVGFDDSNQTIVFPDGRFGNGFCGVDVNLENASTSVDFNNITFIGRGLSGTTDSRPDFELIGNTVPISIDLSVFTNFNMIYLQPNANISITTFNECETVIQSGATIETCAFNSFTSGVTLLANKPSLISDCTFTSDGSNHGIEFTTGGTYSFWDNVFSGYTDVSGDTGNEAIYNTSGEILNLVIKGIGTNPSYRNSPGSTTNIIYNLKTFTLSGLVVDTEVRIYRESDGVEIAGIEDTVDPDFEYYYVYTVDTPVVIRIFNVQYLPISLYLTLENSDNTIPIQQIYDRNYENPA